MIVWSSSSGAVWNNIPRVSGIYGIITVSNSDAAQLDLNGLPDARNTAARLYFQAYHVLRNEVFERNMGADNTQKNRQI